MTSLLLALVSAAAVATSDPPHAAADVFDQDYPAAADCQAALDHARATASAKLERLLAQAECGARTENDRTRFHLRMHWKRFPLHHARRP